MAGNEGRLPAQSTKVLHAAFVGAYAPQSASDDSLDHAIDRWVEQQNKVSRFLAPLCVDNDELCNHYRELEAQARDVAISARVAVQAPQYDRDAPLRRLTELQGNYDAAANAWVGELTAQFSAETKHQQHMLLLWAFTRPHSTYPDSCDRPPLNDQPQTFPPRKIHCRDDVGRIVRGHGEDTRREAPGVDPAQRLRESRLLADKVRISQPVEQRHAGRTCRKVHAVAKRRTHRHQSAANGSVERAVATPPSPP